jgi:polypeptide N-acetylgalactosaminyltransferase
LYKRNLDPGDLTKQKALREKLQCKSFKWFMENVAFDLVNYYPPVPPPPYASGEIRSQANPSLCIDTQHKTSGSSFGLKECLKDNHDRRNGEQVIISNDA